MAWGPPGMVRVAGSRGAVADALRARRPQLLVVALLSAMLNILALTGSIYLMMVYDRVIPGHSLPSLFSLFAMVLAAYLFIALFDSLRALILLDLGHLLHRDLAPRVFDAEQRLARARGDRSEAGLMRDLDQVRGFLGSPGPSALIDLPWIALFLIVLTLIHVWLAVVTVIGALLLVALTIVADRVTGAALGRLRPLTTARALFGQMLQRHADLIPALGMGRDLKARWSRTEGAFLAEQVELAQRTARLRSISSTSRMFVQSCVLTCGAYLVVTDRVLSGGIIFASSILSGRALAPLDAAIGHWRSFTGARQSWRRLDQALAAMPAAAAATTLPPPVESLAVESLTLAPPGARQVVVSEVSFRVQAGQIVGVIGPSASGKSSLLRGLIGLMTIARGAVRLDGATIDQWDDGALGRHVGYLPQSVELLDGSVAENIARFDPTGGSDEVIAAARAAGVHDMIVRLPQGYETRVGEDGGLLSAGQRQRIGLARALFRDPFLVLLDEPNSNLDPDGEAALAASLREIRVRGGIALVAAHRVAVLQTVDLLLVMNAGRVQAFGPRDEILARLQQPPAAPRDGTVVPMRS